MSSCHSPDQLIPMSRYSDVDLPDIRLIRMTLRHARCTQDSSLLSRSLAYMMTGDIVAYNQGLEVGWVQKTHLRDGSPPSPIRVQARAPEPPQSAADTRIFSAVYRARHTARKMRLSALLFVNKIGSRYFVLLWLVAA